MSCSGKNKQAGGTYLPAEYHGHNSGSYVASPAGLADGAYGKQRAVSQGVIGGDGTAGPNLAWAGGSMMTGGGKRKRSQRKRRTSQKKKKMASMKKVGGGCGCNRR